MIETSYIENRLKELNRLYSSAMSSSEDNELPLLYSKIAIIELGGWIEESRDELRDQLLKIITHQNPEDCCKKIYPKHVSGFDYMDHFRKAIFERLIGLHGASELEAQLDEEINLVFKSSMGTLWYQRNICAHRTIKGTQVSIQSPSSTMKQFKNIEPGLKQLEAAINCLKRDKLDVLA